MMNALTRFRKNGRPVPELVRRFMRPRASTNIESPAEIRLDVTEREQDYLVRAEIPGAKKEDIPVQIDRNYVSISAEVMREQENKQDSGRLLLKEAAIGSAMLVTC